MLNWRTIFLTLAIGLSIILIGNAVTPYKRVVPPPKKLDQVISLVLEMAEALVLDIEEDIAYADYRLSLGMTMISVRYVEDMLITEWKPLAQAKLDALNALMLPLYPHALIVTLP